MSDREAFQDGVWFVYDGECPICTMAAEALQVKKALGDLHLIDARENSTMPLVKKLTQLGYDLDEGMVIYHGGQFYHGQAALHFMAVFAAPKGIFNRLNRALFRVKPVAAFLYPFMRGVRNLLIKLRGKSKIDNLRRRGLPIFQEVFGESWQELPSVMHMHYANRPYCEESLRAVGTMSVTSSPLLRMFSPLLRLLGGIPAVNAVDAPVTVDFMSEKGGVGLHFQRSFYFKPDKPYIFHSVMMPQGGNEIIEVMKFRLGWRVRFLWENGKVLLNHKGYTLCLFGWFIPLPLDYIIGRIHAEEDPLDDTHFRMFVEIIHPLFGKIYDYRGTFEMVINEA